MALVALTAVLLAEMAYPQNEKRIRRDDLCVESRVSVAELSDGYLSFRYVFENSDTSKQKLVGVAIELNDDWTEYGGSLRNLMAPKEKDWGEFPTVAEKMRWVTAYDTTGRDILEGPPMSAILPGERISFSFEARGLPGIGLFWAEGWAPWYFTAEERDSLLREGYPESDLQLSDDNSFKGVTVVRRSPPEPFVPRIFVDTLLSYTRQSAEFGWLGNQRDNDCDQDERPGDGIVKNIELRLQKAKRELTRGDSVQTRKELEKLLQKVERIWKRSQEHEKKHKRDGWERKENVIMTSEAYALLKYNTEYLIDRLPDKSKHGREDDKDGRPNK